jgi:glycosyltransferase involved in cell wall biosynthesis
VLITTSRLVKKNGVDTVIRALPLLPKDVTFRVLGTGPEEDALKALARELHVEERVEFVGYVSHAEMPSHLHKADIFVRPSRSEGFGNSFVEAFAAGLPVIATQVGGIADFLYDAKRNPDKQTTGWAVDVESPEHIAAAVKDILHKPEKTEEIVARAHKLAVETYDWDIVAKAMRGQVFDSVLKN